MSNLPHGWTRAPFGQLFDFKGGSQPPKATFSPHQKPGYVRLLQIRDFESDAKAVFIKDSSRWPKCSTNDIMIGRYGASVGKVLTGKSGAYNVALVKMIFEPNFFDASWVRLFLLSPHFQEPLKRISRSAQNGFNKADLEEIEVPLPPFAEQRRIVAKINSLSAKSKRARDQLDHVPHLVEKYKQAILVAAFSGELTRAWRTKGGIVDDLTTYGELPRELSDRLLPRVWAMKPVEQVASNHDGKRIPVRAADRALRQGTFPYYGASGVIDTIDDYLFDGDFLLIGEDGANLLSRSTPIAFPASGRFWVNNHAHILQTGSDTSNNWLRWYINMIDLSPFVTGTAQPKLTQAALNKIILPLPGIDEQQEILRRIEVAFSWVDRVASEAGKARKLIDHLDQATLAEAFQGELVPQDPADEPASVLLERIRAERAVSSTDADGKASRVRKRGKSHDATTGA